MLFHILMASSAISFTTLYLYIRYMHQSLARQIKDTNVTAEARKAAYASGGIEIPSNFVENPQRFRIIHENHEALQKIPLPPVNDEEAGVLLTQLMRRNMRCFSKMPQSLMLRLFSRTPEQKQSFSQSHIETLNFQKGDLICGFTQVLNRSPLKVEMEMLAPEKMGNFSGRLICSLKWEEHGAVLSTQTLQWTKVEDSTVLPIEKGPAKFLHELTSWWLLVSGTRYLQRLSSS